mgnify:CR=1 FL=1
MEPTHLLPDSDLNKYWRWHWAVWMIIICVPQLILALGLPYPGYLILGITFAVSVVIFILIRLYLPLYYDSLTYMLEDDVVVGTRGVFWKKRVTVPLRRITNIDTSQGPVQRMFGLGTIHLQTAGAGGAQGAVAELRVEGMKEFESIKDNILSLLRAYHDRRAASAGEASPGDDAAPAANAPLAGDTAQAMLEELRAIRRQLEQS